MKINGKDIKKLPPPEKKVSCSVLRKLGFSYRQIKDIVNVPTTTAFNYAKGETPANLEQFETELKENFKDYEVILAAKAASRIDKTIDRATIKNALEVYTTMTNKDKAPAVAVQTNVNIQQNKEVNYEQLGNKNIGLVERIQAAKPEGSTEGSEPAGGASPSSGDQQG